eukprot:gb/GECH01011326.1/.p1 GENE.gb/GECH01011326.1/~~gb/GECH01011326.1/.p1  ORF type:complete len:312 (+),score=110.17 gb/GECH01011326.1/:1-936(+)
MPDSYQRLQEEQDSRPQQQQQPQRQPPNMVPSPTVFQQQQQQQPPPPPAAVPRSGLYPNNNTNNHSSPFSSSWNYQQYRQNVPFQPQTQTQQPQQLNSVPQESSSQQQQQQGKETENRTTTTTNNEDTSENNNNNNQEGNSTTRPQNETPSNTGIYPELSDMNGTGTNSYPWIHPKPAYPLLVAICSFILPGVGHMLLGQHRKGLWLFVLSSLFSILMAIMSRGVFLALFHCFIFIIYSIILAIDAFRTAKRIRQGYPLYHGECDNVFVTALLKEFSWMGKDTPVFNRRVAAECPSEWKSVIHYFDSQRRV